MLRWSAKSWIGVGLLASCSPDTRIVSGATAGCGGTIAGSGSSAAGAGGSLGGSGSQGGAAPRGGSGATEAGGSSSVGGSAGASSASGSAGESGSGDGGAGNPSVCSPGADPTCNDDPFISSLQGTCRSDGTCACNSGSVLNPETGRCRYVNRSSCYSPEQNLDTAYELGALGCPCNPDTEFGTCRTSEQGNEVALVCSNGNWEAVEDGRCAQNGCFVTRQVVLPAGNADQGGGRELRVARSGSTFAVTDQDASSGSWVSMAQLSWLFGVGEQATFTPAGPLLGSAVVQTDLGHQLIVIDQGGGLGQPPQYLARSTAWEMGSSEPVQESDLFVIDDEVQIAEFHTVNSRDGRRALFAHRIENAFAVALLGGDGVPVVPYYGMYVLEEGPFRCLELFPTETAAILSFFVEGPTGEIHWNVREFHVDGGVSFAMANRIQGMTELPETCPAVVPYDAGYYTSVMWEDGTGSLAFIRPERSSDAAGLVDLPFPPNTVRVPSFARFELLGDEFVFIHGEPEDVVVTHVDALGAAETSSLWLPDGASSTPAVVDAEGETLYVRYNVGESPAFAEVVCRR
jgi:hypothetical protein